MTDMEILNDVRYAQTLQELKKAVENVIMRLYEDEEKNNQIMRVIYASSLTFVDTARSLAISK